jgi:molybdopterin molybdotransferase
LAAVIERAAEHHDVVLLTGGVSVGDYDFVVQASTQVGVEGVFHKIKQKPGKPIFFGHRTSNQTGQSTVIFGLPGNPGSVMTCFYLYVRPALVKMSGMPTLIGSTSAQFNDSYSKPIGMTHFLKGVYDRELGGNSLPSVRLLGAQESYRLSSFSVANCLIEIPEDRSEIAAGTSVIVHLFG